MTREWNQVLPPRCAMAASAHCRGRLRALACAVLTVLLVAPWARRVGASFPCAGDCGDDGQVTIDELVTGVDVALGIAASGACAAIDQNGDGAATIDELIKAVNKALGTCFDATVALPGLVGATDVVYDSLGIPHIYGPDLKSVLFAQGYETAKVRFWQMDAYRRAAEGRLSELLGPLTVATDVAQRTLFTTRDGRRLEEALWEHVQQRAPDVAELFIAYADGVNAWLADLRAGRNGATLPPEYGSIDDLDDWRPQDTAAIARYQALVIWHRLNIELGFAAAAATLSDAVFRDLVRSAPVAPTTVLPVAPGMAQSAAALAQPPVASLPPLAVVNSVLELLDQMQAWSLLGGRESGGSNDWVVAPSLSASGHAMLANDPHVILSNPAALHTLQLDAGPALRAEGVGFPGIPGVLWGHNDYGAWGVTHGGIDDTDVYVETVSTPPGYPASPRTVRLKDQQVEVQRIEETIRMKGGDPVTAVIEVVPHHGPMIPDPNLNDGVVGLAATNMTFRWTGHEMTDEALTLFGLQRARNVEEFKAAIRDWGVPLQNWVWADIDGNIAYFAYALVPQRPACAPACPPYLPMPGTGEAEWLQDEAGNVLWLPEEKLPQLTNPSQGFIATANNDHFGSTLDNDPLNDEIYLGFSFDPGLRAQRIDDLLSNRVQVRPPGGTITLGDMSAYQYDTASYEAARLLPFLFAAAENRPDLVTAAMSDALDRLRAWAVEKPGSPACDTPSGIDPHDLRADVPPRSTPVTDEERADAVASSLYAAWLKRAWQAVQLALPPAGLQAFLRTGEYGTKALLHILEDIDRTDAFQVYTKGLNGESTLWDKPGTPAVETRDEVLLGSLRGGLSLLQQQFASPDMNDWLWGEIHQVRFQHFFGQAGVLTLDLGGFAAPGGRLTVNVANYSPVTDSFTFSAGPSERFLVELDPGGIRAFNSFPGGNNGNPGDLTKYNQINPEIHYGDLIPGWLNGEWFEYRTSRAALAADSQRHVRYVPEGGVR